MNVDVVVTVVMAVAAVMGALFFLGRKVRRGTEILLLDLVPVIRALGRVRSGGSSAGAAAAQTA